MLRLSNSCVRLRIAGDGLAATLCARWPRLKVRARTKQAWPASAVPGAEAQAALGAALDRALQELARTGPVRHAVLDVELDDALVHFDVARGEFGGHSEHQLATVTRACTQDLLGEAAGSHTLRWQLQADERHLLMCAVPLDLLACLRDAAVRHGLRLRAVQPRFPARWNRHHRALRKGLGVFASGHDAHAVIAFVRDGVVEAIIAGSCPAELEDPHSPAPVVDRLLNSLGLENTATPTRLDAQVDRLIASLGVDARQLKQFIAVDSGRNGQALSSRWQLLDQGGAAP